MEVALGRVENLLHFPERFLQTQEGERHFGNFKRVHMLLTILLYETCLAQINNVLGVYSQISCLLPIRPVHNRNKYLVGTVLFDCA